LKKSDAFDLTQAPLETVPFEYLCKQQFLRPDIYEEIAQHYPVCSSSTGPTGFSYYWGDPEYDQLLRESPAWKAFFETAHSQAFIDACIQQFKPAFIAHGCRIDLEKAVYVPYRESREDKERRHILDVRHQPHELFVRLDVHQGYAGYSRAVHLDHRRRLMSMLIYFCDQGDMTGGELVLHGTRFRVLRPEMARVKPQPNLMAAFACSPISYHSVPVIKSQVSPRNFVQIQISSSVDAWPS
jgi:hypothetical protein